MDNSVFDIVYLTVNDNVNKLVKFWNEDDFRCEQTTIASIRILSY